MTSTKLAGTTFLLLLAAVLPEVLGVSLPFGVPPARPEPWRLKVLAALGVAAPMVVGPGVAAAVAAAELDCGTVSDAVAAGLSF